MRARVRPVPVAGGRARDRADGASTSSRPDSTPAIESKDRDRIAATVAAVDTRGRRASSATSSRRRRSGPSTARLQATLRGRYAELESRAATARRPGAIGAGRGSSARPDLAVPSITVLGAAAVAARSTRPPRPTGPRPRAALDEYARRLERCVAALDDGRGAATARRCARATTCADCSARTGRAPPRAGLAEDAALTDGLPGGARRALVGPVRPRRGRASSSTATNTRCASPSASTRFAEASHREGSSS